MGTLTDGTRIIDPVAHARPADGKPNQSQIKREGTVCHILRVTIRQPDRVGHIDAANLPQSRNSGTHA